MLRQIDWVVRHAFHRKILVPRRHKQWRRKTAPFVFKAAKGFTYELHPGEYVDEHIFLDGIYERRFLESIELYFNTLASPVALDVGANIGNHAIFLSPRFQQIHCFDPNPVALARLRGNIARNALRNIAVHPVGLSDQAAALDFEVNEKGNLGASHFLEKPTADSIQLSVVVGDDYVAGLGLDRLDFVKVDVEDHEAQVFRGLRATIARHCPIVAFEYHGGKVPLSTFEAIAASLPGYVFAEARFAAAELPVLEKLRWHLKRRGRPSFVRFDLPEARTYENILGFPDEATFAAYEDVNG